MSPSSESRPSRDDTLHLRATDELASLALNEPIPADIAEHVAGCADCRAEVDAYRAVVELARIRPSTGDDADPVPPTLWDRIQADLTAGPSAATPEPETTVPAPVPPPIVTARRSAPRAILLAAAAVVVVAVGVTGWLVGRSTSPSAPSTAAHAALSAQPGTTAGARGTATMRTSSDGYQLDLDTSGLPAPDGYYEVWLYDPSIERMVAIGTLGTGARGTFTVPAGIDVGAYHVVDVSAQRYDGDAAHQRSVLRGSLTQS